MVATASDSTAGDGALVAPIIYPTSVDGITGAWLRERIEAANPSLRLGNAHRSRIIWGTATKVFFDIEYSSLGNTITETASICVKGNFSEKMRGYYDMGILYTTEAAFYRDIAPELDLVLPRCWFAIEDSIEGIVALDDLAAQNVTFGQPFDRWTAEEARPILASFARLHAHCWGWRAGRLPWLTLGSGGQRKGLSAMLSGDRYATLTARPEVRSFVPTSLAEQDRILDALAELWRTDDLSGELTVCHGDAHLGQTYVTVDGQRGLLDWQSVAIMPWAKDVSYFLGGALSVDDRRAHERELLEYYLVELERAGGPRLDRESAWHQYRKQMLCGIVWPVVIEEMQPIEGIATMSERYLTALVDLDTIGAIYS